MTALLEMEMKVSSLTTISEQSKVGLLAGRADIT
jgi:hypothetical protein